jgi:7,8-dihydroneopterin aldolase/epimerase/oxygenase
MADTSFHATSRTVFVRGLEVQAEVGLYVHEHGVRQPLVCDVELRVSGWGHELIGETVNYERIRELAKGLAEAGHWKLVETFAEALAGALMENDRVLTARVRVEKTMALRPDAAAAGVEIVLERDAP